MLDYVETARFILGFFCGMYDISQRNAVSVALRTAQPVVGFSRRQSPKQLTLVAGKFAFKEQSRLLGARDIVLVLVRVSPTVEIMQRNPPRRL